MKKSAASVAKFISKHRVLIAIGMTTTAFLLLMRRNAKEIETFMAEHNLSDEYARWLIDAD